MSKDPASADVESTQSKPPFRPNLSQSISPGNNDERILSSLGDPNKFVKNGGPAKRLPGTFAGLMLATAVAAGAGYWYFVDQQASRPKAQEIAKTDATVTTAKADQSPVGTALVAGSAGQAAQSLPLAEQAAQIVNDSKATNPSNANAEAKLTDALENGVKPPDAAIQKALESKPKSAESTAAADATKSASASPAVKGDAKSKAAGTQTAKASTTSNPANTKSSANASSKVAAANRSAPAASSKNTTPAGDKDINLIAALLAHNAANPTSTKPQGTVKVNTDVAVTSAATSTAAAEPISKPTAASTSTKSMVAARTDASESVLKQCEGLDFLQREVCRIKVCDKLWEIDSSCKATLSSAK